MHHKFIYVRFHINYDACIKGFGMSLASIYFFSNDVTPHHSKSELAIMSRNSIVCKVKSKYIYISIKPPNSIFFSVVFKTVNSPNFAITSSMKLYFMCNAMCYIFISLLLKLQTYSSNPENEWPVSVQYITTYIHIQNIPEHYSFIYCMPHIYIE